MQDLVTASLVKLSFSGLAVASFSRDREVTSGAPGGGFGDRRPLLGVHYGSIILRAFSATKSFWGTYRTRGGGPTLGLGASGPTASSGRESGGVVVSKA